MRPLSVFFKKELLETWRTRRFGILTVVFLLFALMSPLAAKLTPDLLRLSLGTAVKLPPPTSVDSWTQFYKNISQMGIYIIAILFGGTVSRELAGKTLVNLVTKGLPRWAVIIAKYLCLLSQWLVVMAGAFFTTWGYTTFYFSDRQSPHPVAACLPLLVFGAFFLAVVLFGSTWGRHTYEGLLFTCLVMAILFLVKLLKRAHNFNPVSLIGDNVAILQGNLSLTKLFPAMGVALGLTLILIVSSVVLLNKKALV